MKKLTSKINGREFYVGDNLPSHLDGIPCFSLKEVDKMRGVAFSIHDLNLIFDTKLVFSAVVETVRQDIGYNNHKPSERIALAQDYGSKIKDMLRGMGARTDEEKKI